MKSRLFSLFVSVVCTLTLSAQTHFSTNTPDVDFFLPQQNIADGRIVVICPGGGYTILATEHEGTDWSQFFNDRGIAVAVLKYRMPEGDPSIPISDVENTIELIKRNAQEWNVNPHKIGIMGSSAGGHLASLIATTTNEKVRPAFQVLFYPVISMDKSITHIHSHNKLLGVNAGTELENSYSSEKRVTDKTPRAYIAFSDDDDAVTPLNGIIYYEALHRCGVPASLYIYPTGGHGWGYNPFTYRNEMLDDLSAWLKSFK